MIKAMNLFRSKAEKELDSILSELRAYLENNYKDAAHDQRKKLGERCEALYSEGKLKEKAYLGYKKLYEEYTEKMKDYHH